MRRSSKTPKEEEEKQLKMKNTYRKQIKSCLR